MLSHAEMARESALWTAAFIGLHIICRWLSQLLFPTYTQLSAPDKVRPHQSTSAMCSAVPRYGLCHMMGCIAA
eukprot:5972483-Prymnesium_polylepis.1